jgi:cytochrome c oxidase subunit 2
MNRRQVEYLFTAVVLIVLIASALVNLGYVLGHTQNIPQPADNKTVPANSTVIQVLGYQWAWQFTYSNNTTSTDTLYVTVGHEYTLQVTSKDVIHDLLIPSLGVQVYAVPDHPNQVSFEPEKTGKYIFECVEYCGQDHYLMRGYMVVSP